MTHLIELAEKDIQRVIINIFHIFNKGILRLTMLSSNMGDILKDPSQDLELKLQRLR